MQVIGTVQHGRNRRSLRQRSTGAVPDIEHKIARSIRTVAHEGAARRAVCVNADGRDIDPVGSKAVQVQAPEIIIAHHRDDPAGLTDTGDLIDEDGRCAGRVGSRQPDWLLEPVADTVCHDLHQDFPGNHDLLHGRTPFFAGRGPRACNPVPCTGLTGASWEA